MPPDLVEKLKHLYWHYFNKNPLSARLRTQLVGDPKTLAKRMIREHKQRLKLADLAGVAEVSKSRDGEDVPKRVEGEDLTNSEESVSKAYLMYIKQIDEKLQNLLPVVLAWA